MMKGKATDSRKSFARFCRRHNLTPERVSQIAVDYAKSTPDLARSHFMEKYHISEHVFYRCLDFSIICCLVDDATCKRITDKSALNCRSHNDKNSSRRSSAHAMELLRARDAFLKSFSNDEIRNMAARLINGEKSHDVAASYNTSRLAINFLVGRGIENLILDRETVQQLERLAPDNSYLIASLEKRENLKSKLI